MATAPAPTTRRGVLHIHLNPERVFDGVFVALLSLMFSVLLLVKT